MPDKEWAGTTVGGAPQIVQQAAHEGGLAGVHVPQHDEVKQWLARLPGRLARQRLLHCPCQIWLRLILPQWPLQGHSRVLSSTAEPALPREPANNSCTDTQQAPALHPLVHPLPTKSVAAHPVDICSYLSSKTVYIESEQVSVCHGDQKIGPRLWSGPSIMGLS